MRFSIIITITSFAHMLVIPIGAYWGVNADLWLEFSAGHKRTMLQLLELWMLININALQ